MTNNRAWSNPAVRANPSVALAMSRSDHGGGGQPSELVVVEGTGFGPSPNVVGFRTFSQGTPNEDRVSLLPPEGEIGALEAHALYGPPTIGLIDGQVAMFAHDDAIGRQRTVTLHFPKTRRFRMFCKIGVPEGFAFPGGYQFYNSASSVLLGPRTFSDDSGCKPIWIQNEGLGSDVYPNICIPTHTGKGNIAATGNGVATIGRWANSGRGHEVFEWDTLNGFGYKQDCDPEDPAGNVSEQELLISNRIVTDDKPHFNHIQTIKDKPSFVPTGARLTKAGSPYTPEECYYDRITLAAYSRFQPGCQIAFADFYLATESEEGAGDWNQCVFLGNAPNFEDCGKLICVPPVSWSNARVSFKRRPGYTHYHIIKPNNTIASGAL